MIESEILQAIRQILIVKTALGLNERTCLLTLSEFVPPKMPRGGRYFVTIAPNRSDFPIDEQDEQQLTERMVVTITAYVRVDLDPVDTAAAILLDAQRGLYMAKQEIILSLAGKMLFDAASRPLLREHLRVTFCSEPRHDTEQRLAWLSVDVQAVFDR
ncbi:MAG: hypothetical protein H5T92_07380 [Synergistales bacterium]|nr:hypothetical protein [Synergistales bacterium]